MPRSGMRVALLVLTSQQYHRHWGKRIHVHSQYPMRFPQSQIAANLGLSQWCLARGGLQGKLLYQRSLYSVEHGCPVSRHVTPASVSLFPGSPRMMTSLSRGHHQYPSLEPCLWTVLGPPESPHDLHGPPTQGPTRCLSPSSSAHLAAPTQARTKYRHPRHDKLHKAQHMKCHVLPAIHHLPLVVEWRTTRFPTAPVCPWPPWPLTPPTARAPPHRVRWVFLLPTLRSLEGAVWVWPRPPPQWVHSTHLSTHSRPLGVGDLSVWAPSIWEPTPTHHPRWAQREIPEDDSNARNLPGIHQCLWIYMYYVNWLVQERRNSSALAMELRLSCTNPFMWGLKYQQIIKWLLELQNCEINCQLPNSLVT